MVTINSPTKVDNVTGSRWFNWPIPEDATRDLELADESDDAPDAEEAEQTEPTIIDIGDRPTYLLVAYRLAQYEAVSRLSSLLPGHPHEQALRRIWRDYAHFSGWLLSWEITEQVQQRLLEIDLPPVTSIVD